MGRLIPVIKLLAVVSITGVFLTFNNCGQEGFEVSSFDSENFIYLSYKTTSGEEKIRKAHFQEADGDLYIDGDVLIGSAQEISIGQIVPVNLALPPQILEESPSGTKIQNALKSNENSIWSGAKVPYVVGRSVSIENERKLIESLERFNFRLQEAGVHLEIVRRNSERDYIEFVEKDLSFPMGGQSYIGRVGGRQELKIRQDQFVDIIIHHELLHALGFKHEHQRTDRKLVIKYENITESLKYNFATFSAGTNVGDYDHDSLLHYHSYAFSKNGRPTITKLNGDTISRARELSEKDVSSIGEVYGTKERINDGYYHYRSVAYFKVEDGHFCQLKKRESSANYASLSLPQTTKLSLQGPMPNLTYGTYCNNSPSNELSASLVE